MLNYSVAELRIKIEAGCFSGILMIPYISGKGFAYKDIIRLLHGMSGRFLHFNHSLIKNSPNLSLNSL